MSTLIGKLSHSDVNCRLVAPRVEGPELRSTWCSCAFEIWRDGKLIASTPNATTHVMLLRFLVGGS